MHAAPHLVASNPHAKDLAAPPCLLHPLLQPPAVFHLRSRIHFQSNRILFRESLYNEEMEVIGLALDLGWKCCCFHDCVSFLELPHPPSVSAPRGQLCPSPPYPAPGDRIAARCRVAGDVPCPLFPSKSSSHWWLVKYPPPDPLRGSISETWPLIKQLPIYFEDRIRLN